MATRHLFDEIGTATQAEREAVAARRLFGLLPAGQATEFLALWAEFEAAETADAKFAKAIDRLQPILLNHAVGGGTWTDYDVDEARERSLTRRIADGSPTLWRVAEAVINDAVDRGLAQAGRHLSSALQRGSGVSRDRRARDARRRNGYRSAKRQGKPVFTNRHFLLLAQALLRFRIGTRTTPAFTPRSSRYLNCPSNLIGHDHPNNTANGVGE